MPTDTLFSMDWKNTDILNSLSDLGSLDDGSLPTQLHGIPLTSKSEQQITRDLSTLSKHLPESCGSAHSEICDLSLDLNSRLTALSSCHKYFHQRKMCFFLFSPSTLSYFILTIKWVQPWSESCSWRWIYWYQNEFFTSLQGSYLSHWRQWLALVCKETESHISCLLSLLESKSCGQWTTLDNEFSTDSLCNQKTAQACRHVLPFSQTRHLAQSSACK